MICECSHKKEDHMLNEYYCYKQKRFGKAQFICYCRGFKAGN